MKPIIIYVDSERDEIKLSRKQFEKFIQDAYQQGYDNGYADGSKRYYWYPYTYTSTATNASIPQPPSITYRTGTDPNTFKPSVTCAPYTGEQCINATISGEAHNSIGD